MTPPVSVVELRRLDGTDGFVINGIDSGDFSGFSVSDAGDVNGDGIDDIIIGANGANPNDSGGSYVVFGQAGSCIGSDCKIRFGYNVHEATLYLITTIAIYLAHSKFFAQNINL